MPKVEIILKEKCAQIFIYIYKFVEFVYNGKTDCFLNFWGFSKKISLLFHLCWNKYTSVSKKSTVLLYVGIFLAKSYESNLPSELL